MGWRWPGSQGPAKPHPKLSKNLGCVSPASSSSLFSRLHVSRSLLPQCHQVSSRRFAPPLVSITSLLLLSSFSSLGPVAILFSLYYTDECDGH